MNRLSIIIVNYKTPRLIVDCLDTIFAYPHDFEIIVVDNASGDNSREFVLGRYPQVKWIEMGYNAGFARANNAGIRSSIGNVVLLLNSDTLNLDDSINKCFHQFVNSTYVACGVQLLNPDHSFQISGSFFMKGSVNNFLPLPFVGAWVKALGTTLKIKKPHADETFSLMEIDWINGAFLMVKKSVIEKAGLLDEDFFLYAEEAEWCYRLRRFGKMIIYTNCQVVHLQGESANEAFNSAGQGYYNLYDRKGLQIMLSNFVRIRKQNGTSWFFIHLFIYSITIPIFLVGLLLSKKKLSEWWGFTKNVSTIWKLSYRIVSNKSYFYKVL